VIVNNFNIRRAFTGPKKANPPLVVYSNAELAVAVASQSLETISRGNTQIIQLR
jgi:hypothetical protein